jgi:23S rRNA (cytosine1962-C5)-methyltransferase
MLLIYHNLCHRRVIGPCILGEKVKLPQIHLSKAWTIEHPWIFERNIKPNRKLPPGTLVEIVSKQGKVVGTGIYNQHTPVAIRRLTGPGEVADEKFIFKMLEQAKKLREAWLPGQNSYRLCHSEADGLSGLMIEKYANVLLIEPISAGWLFLMEDVCSALSKLYPDHSIKVMGNERHEEREKVSFTVLEERWPGPKSVEIEENGVKLTVRFDLGHKTGFFLDQRENRKILAKHTKGKSLLDLCCNTGGFSLAAAKNGCQEITAVDLDEKALEVAEKNSRVNQVKVAFKHANAFDFMRSAIENKKVWDVWCWTRPSWWGINLK